MDDGRIGTGLGLRPARAEDAGACAAIVDGWIAETAWMPRLHPRSEIERHLRDEVLPTHAVMLAERGGAPVGFVSTAGGQVGGLFVAAAARRGGVGTALLDWAKAGNHRGLMLWTFVANGPARAFYRRHGFVELRRTAGENEERLPDILLAWQGVP